LAAVYACAVFRNVNKSHQKSQDQDQSHKCQNCNQNDSVIEFLVINSCNVSAQ